MYGRHNLYLKLHM